MSNTMHTNHLSATMLTRRHFLQFAALGTTGLFLATQGRQAYAAPAADQAQLQLNPSLLICKV